LEGSTLTHTVRKTPSTPRIDRLARARVSSADAARIDALEARAQRRADLAAAVAHATTRVYAPDYYTTAADTGPATAKDVTS